ncbi:MAG: type II toxin-antitoxin system Phd/YefM family antitoxin [Coriobacteriales bacterium]|nr:type II toxin-antitoxin system Phd/YefM family antitoxin [Coriobacteriales bacterium]
MTTVTISVSEAKTQFSNVIHQVENNAVQYIVSKNNKPVARIVPIAGYEQKSLFGVLASYADSTLRAKESSAFAQEMEHKHAANS